MGENHHEPFPLSFNSSFAAGKAGEQEVRGRRGVCGGH
jgi:hypothetical protein